MKFAHDSPHSTSRTRRSSDCAGAVKETEASLNRNALARWDNEGGAEPMLTLERSETSHMRDMDVAPIAPTNQRWRIRLAGNAHVLIRPISKSDGHAERAFIEALSATTKRMRFMASIQHPSDGFIAKLTDVDGVHDVALAAVVYDGAVEKLVGVSRYSQHETENCCACALAVSDDWQHKGLGTALMRHLVAIASANGLAMMESVEFAENLEMRALMLKLGFRVRADPEDARQSIFTLALQANPAH